GREAVLVSRPGVLPSHFLVNAGLHVTKCCLPTTKGQRPLTVLYNHASPLTFIRSRKFWRKQKLESLVAVGSTTCPALLTFTNSRKTLHSARHPTHTFWVRSKGRRWHSLLVMAVDTVLCPANSTSAPTFTDSNSSASSAFCPFQQWDH